MLIAIKDLDLYISDGNYSAKYPRSDEFVDSGIPFIRANNFVEGDISDDEMYFITPEKHSVLLKGHVKSGDVLITTRGNIGQVAVVPERHEDSNINAQIVLFRTKPEKLYNRYLFWALQSQSANEQYYSLQTGTALKQLPVGKLERLKINVTSIKEQHRIADNLDKAYKIIKERRKELALLDNLIKARFVEMFGDPVTNPMKWLETTVGDECHYIKDGPHKSLPDIGEENGGHPFISVRNIVNHTIDFSTARYISDSDYVEARKRCCPEKGDMLYSKGGTTGIAKLIDTDVEFANWVHLAVLKFDRQKLNGVFFENMLNSDYCYIQSQHLTKGIANRDLVLSAMAQIKMFRPPFELQEQFAEFVRQVDKSKSVVQKSLDEAQLLFDSLMQKYFG